MTSRITEDFLNCFARLPGEVQTQARKSYRLWKQNPAHPSLHFKRVSRRDPLYSVRVGLGWRVLGLLDGDTVTWFWVGSHAEYDNLIS
jgi:hypothetical protein